MVWQDPDEGGGRARQVRDERLQSLFRREIALLIKSLSDPKLEGLELFSLEVAPDGSRIRIVCVPTIQTRFTKGEIEKALEKSAPYIRHCLAEILSLKRTPVVSLRYAPDLTMPSKPDSER